VATKECVVLNTPFPEVLGPVSRWEIEFDGVLVVSRSLGMELDEEFAAFETELADLRPGEGVDLHAALTNENAIVCNSQLKWCTIMILCLKQMYTIHLDLASCVQKVEVSV
jgi:hypothetical protein